jgi:uncharacterized protein (TIGR02145 family)
MKKYFFITFLLVVILKINAEDYVISFTGTGASTTFDSVKVENLTQNTSIIVPGGNQLRLNVIATGINSLIDGTKSPLSIYPNPAKEFCLVEFDLLKDSKTTFEIFDLSGKIVTQMESKLESGKHSYSISGLCSGAYLISVKTNGYHYTGKIISQSDTKGDVQISYCKRSEKIESTRVNKLKSTDTETTMQFSSGNRLLYTGISGIYRTIFTDIPTESKTITFTFVNCTDADNNNYPVVTIGSQTWMAENLKYLPSVVGPATSSDTISHYYVYGYDGTVVADAKATANYTTYGVLYNWPAAMNGAASSTSNPSGVQGACPTGWHLPSDAEWTTLENYLIANGYNYDGTTTDNKIAKALASTTYWNLYTDIAGVVGNTDYPAKQNATGFTALPGGVSLITGEFSNINDNCSWWSSTEFNPQCAWIRNLRSSFYGINRYFGNLKCYGISVRCVKDL